MGRRKSIKTSILGLRYLVTMTALSLCETVEARKIVTPIEYTSPPNQNAPGVLLPHGESTNLKGWRISHERHLRSRDFWKRAPIYRCKRTAPG